MTRNKFQVSRNIANFKVLECKEGHTRHPNLPSPEFIIRRHVVLDTFYRLIMTNRPIVAMFKRVGPLD